MALVAIEGFDFYGNQSQLAMKYPHGSSGTLNFSTGRISQSCLVVPSGVNQFSLSPFSPYGSCIVGFGIKFVGTLSLITNLVKFRYDNVTHFSLNLNANGTITAVTQSPVGTSSTVYAIQPGVWYYLEVQFQIHPTAGNIAVLGNGIPWISAPICNSYNSLSPVQSINRITWANVSGSSCDVHVDDVYVLTTQSPAPTTELGAVFIETRMPVADAVTDWTPVGSADHFDCVDNIPVDSMYLQSVTPGDIDTFTLQSRVSQNKVLAVDCNVLKRAGDGEPPTLSFLLNDTSTDYQITAEPASLYSTYQHSLLAKDPFTNVAWVNATLDTYTFGFKRED